MSVDKLRERLLPRTKKRFDEVWDLLFRPRVPELARDAKPEKKQHRQQSRLQASHAQRLVECGVAQPATGSGALLNVPFTVLEEKPAGKRQRFILWTKDANELAERAGYKAHVPLGHVSRYLDAVNAECGTTRDFKTGFFAVEIPEEARWLFRFEDDEGAAYELTRLPMGHVCAPELMHTLAAAVAGDPLYVLPQFAAKGVAVDVWIDNVRYTGCQRAVLRETERLDRTARQCGVTWKTEDNVTACRAYGFIGVWFDHGAATVQPAEKLVGKLRAVDFDKADAGELESLGGRLLHASAIAGVSPGDYWFALKFLRRIANKLNGARMSVDERVPLPGSARILLRRWIDDVQIARKVEGVRVGGPKFLVFVDASMKGWGAVVIDRRTMEVSVLGKSWRPEEAEHINVLEAEALARTVVALPSHAEEGHVDIRVDNTTVMHVVRRRSCVRSKPLNDAAMCALRELRRRKLTFSLEWVATEQNVADLPSRVDPSEPARKLDVVLAVGAMLRAQGVVV